MRLQEEVDLEFARQLQEELDQQEQLVRAVEARERWIEAVEVGYAPPRFGLEPYADELTFATQEQGLGRRQPQEDDRPAAPSERQLQRLPTHKAAGKLLEEECPICAQDYEEGEELKTLPCLHVFHCKCIDQWLTSRRASSLNCPMCNAAVNL